MGTKYFIGLLLVLGFIPLTVFPQLKLEKPERPKVGLVLSGGGAKGFAHIGALKVLHEAGLQFDYVGGTSMGSIIGGFYAIGYHPDSMEAIVQAQDWSGLIADRIPRQYIPIDEKRNSDRILLSFPIRGRKIVMRQGLNNGLLIDLMLSRFTSPAFTTTDFTKFPVPFTCIATNLEDGSSVVMRDGILPLSLRASMSIPTFFTPIEMDDLLLVDGGVINNFPVKDVKEMGADIIIGVDVQAGLHPRDQLNSIVTILDQVVTFYRMEANKEGIGLTDIYIKPDLLPYEVMSFTDYDSIIKRGETATRAHFDELKQLADSINAIAPRKPMVFDTRPLDSVFVSTTEFRGLYDASLSYLVGMLDIKPMTYVNLNRLERSIIRAYASNLFEHIRYYLLPDIDGARLVVEATEASYGMLGAGVNYDSDYKVSLLLNATFRNFFVRGSNLYIDFNLGENPFFKSAYIVDRGTKPGFGIGFTSLRLDFRQYERNRVLESYRATHNKIDTYMLLTFDNAVRFRAGLEYEYSRIRTEINPGDFDSFASYLNFFVDWTADTYNRSAFATKGIGFNFKTKYVTNISDNWSNQIFDNSLIVQLQYNQAIPTGKKSSIIPKFNLGFTLNDHTPPPQHWFILGGQTQTNYFDGFFPFTGLRFIEQTGHYTISTGIGWQYQIYPNFYLTPKVDAGLISKKFEDMIQTPQLLIGYGLTIGYDSFLGPVQLSLMASNSGGGLLSFINIGYSF